MKLVIIGGGNMGGAILSALVNSEVISPKNILLIERDEEKRIKYQKETNCYVQPGIDKKICRYGIILVALKPQVAKPNMVLLAKYLLPSHLVISIMAGISLKTMETLLKQKKLVRVMPNIPTIIAEGMSVFFTLSDLKPKERKWVNNLFSACGKCLEAKDENAIDAATAISGSGPGYIFYFAEKITQSAMSLGFSEKDAQLLVKNTLRGASLLWEYKNVSPQNLREQVSSSGGTTEVAINHFQENDVGELIHNAIKLAYQRAKELSS